MLKSKRRHLHSKWEISETCRQVHLSRKQRPIYRNDIPTWLAKAWIAIDRLSVIWKSDLSDKIKRSFFFWSAVVTMLLTKRVERKLAGNCTGTLWGVLNKSWRQHLTKQKLYGHLLPISKTIHVKRAVHVGHSWRSKVEFISDILPCTLQRGRSRVGRIARTYRQQLCTDIGCSMEDIPRAMDNRDE